MLLQPVPTPPGIAHPDVSGWLPQSPRCFGGSPYCCAPAQLLPGRLPSAWALLPSHRARGCCNGLAGSRRRSCFTALCFDSYCTGRSASSTCSFAIWPCASAAAAAAAANAAPEAELAGSPLALGWSAKSLAATWAAASSGAHSSSTLLVLAGTCPAGLASARQPPRASRRRSPFVPPRNRRTRPALPRAFCSRC